MRAVFLIAFTISLAACSWLPRVHKITVQQGNVVSQAMVDKLKPGMTRRQVAFVMGEPVLRDSFAPNRWDYVYSIDVPNVGSTTVHVSLFFENDQLSYFTGDFEPTPPTSDTATAAKNPSEPPRDGPAVN